MNHPILFLDIDGVLNDHSQQENMYCGICSEQVRRLNRILKEAPELRLVISSSWRYMISSGSMTVVGFTNLLSTHGVCAWERVHGYTEDDETVNDPNDHLDRRGELIRRYVAQHQPGRWVVLDDLPIPVENLVQTDSETGLTDENVAQVLELLGVAR